MIVRVTLLLSFLSVFNSFSQEICNNGIDDDGDLFIDLNDTECPCASSGSGNPTSLIPNPSFENQTCCPQDYSELNCAVDWVQASDATSDYLNVCGFVGPTGVSNIVPFPDGDGAVGFYGVTNYSEYVGACLTNPMVAGTQYTFQMQVMMSGILPLNGTVCNYAAPSPTLDIFVFGNANCGNIPLTGYLCPMTSGLGYVELVSSTLNTQLTGYQTLTFTFTPTFTINEIIIGAPCNFPAGWLDFSTTDFSECMPYFIADNLVLNTSASFNSLTVSEQGSLCGNDLVISAAATEAGGIYQWFQNGIALVGQTNSNLNVSALSLGQATYQVTYTINGDCYQNEVIVTSSSGSTLTVNDAQICQGETAELTVSGGTSYTWSPGSGLSQTTGSTVSASPNQTTTYTVTSIDENGCVSEATSVVTVIGGPTDVVIDISPLPVETEATLIATPQSYLYTWTNPDGTVSNVNPITYQFPEGDGNFLFTVEAENEFGCKYTKTVQISISSDLIVYVPNSFSPDFDEHNNVFNPVISDNADAQAYSLFIFNRWGELIFESHDPAIGWDGTYDGKLVQSGVYSWSLKLKLTNKDDRRTFVGNVNVLR